MRNKNKPFFYDKKKRPVWQTLLLFFVIILVFLSWAYSVPTVRQIVAEPLTAFFSYGKNLFSRFAGEEQAVSESTNSLPLPTLELPDREVLFAEDISEITANEPLAKAIATDTPEGIRVAEWVYAETTPLPSASEQILENAISVSLPEPVFERADVNNDGTAVLSAALRFLGKNENQYQIAKAIKPDRLDPSVSFEELQAYVTEKYPDLNVLIRTNGNAALLQQLLSAGFPVNIRIEERTGFSWWQNDDHIIGRFILLTGFEEESREFIYQDPSRGNGLHLSFEKILENWYAFGRTYCVVYPRQSESAVISALGDDWNEKANLTRAQEKFKLDSEQASENIFAWLNYGRILTEAQSFEDAWNSLHRADVLGIPQRMLFYDDSILESAFKNGYADEILRLTDEVIGRNAHIEEIWIWRGWAFMLQEKIEEAEEAFRIAEQIRPGNQDTEYALKFISQKMEESR